MTQQALMIDVCQHDQDALTLRTADSIRKLSPDVKDRVKREYVRREANGEAPTYSGKDQKMHDPNHHAHVHLRNYMREKWLK